MRVSRELVKAFYNATLDKKIRQLVNVGEGLDSLRNAEWKDIDPTHQNHLAAMGAEIMQNDRYATIRAEFVKLLNRPEFTQYKAAVLRCYRTVGFLLGRNPNPGALGDHWT